MGIGARWRSDGTPSAMERRRRAITWKGPARPSQSSRGPLASDRTGSCGSHLLALHRSFLADLGLQCWNERHARFLRGNRWQGHLAHRPVSRQGHRQPERLCFSIGSSPHACSVVRSGSRLPRQLCPGRGAPRRMALGWKRSSSLRIYTITAATQRKRSRASSAAPVSRHETPVRSSGHDLRPCA